MSNRVSILISFDDKGYVHRRFPETASQRDPFEEHIAATARALSILHENGGGIESVMNARTLEPCSVVLSISELPDRGLSDEEIEDENSRIIALDGDELRKEVEESTRENLRGSLDDLSRAIGESP